MLASSMHRGRTGSRGRRRSTVPVRISETRQPLRDPSPARGTARAPAEVFVSQGGSMRQVRLSWLVVVLVVAMLAPGVRPASAQSRIVGSVSGTVQDPTGAVVPSARVVLKDAKTGITKEAASTGEGTFFFPDLPVGPYEITVTAQGFQTAVVTDVNVLTSQTTDVRVSLPVGQTSETVTVVSDTTPQLETSSQLVTNTLESTTISE